MSVRWNSTYKKLQRALGENSQLTEFYTNNVASHDIVNGDWELIEQICWILHQLYQSTVILSL